jgi:hypothetical protein
MQDGLTVRCQAVSKTKLRRIRVERGLDPDDKSVGPDDVWPEAQCERPAFRGKLLCGGKGGHGGDSVSVPEFDMLSFMPVDMQDMLRAVMSNPHLLSRRFEMHQLLARIMLLYKKLADDEALGDTSLTIIQQALIDIAKGEVVKGTLAIQIALDKRINERDTYREIFSAMSLLKDMTKTEVSSIKELRGVVTQEQVIALLIGVADDVNKALEEHIDDPRTRQQIAESVDRDTRRRFNASIGGVLRSINEENLLESEAPAPE